jgi:hypothetical protein
MPSAAVAQRCCAGRWRAKRFASMELRFGGEYLITAASENGRQKIAVALITAALSDS